MRNSALEMLAIGSTLASIGILLNANAISWLPIIIIVQFVVNPHLYCTMAKLMVEMIFWNKLTTRAK